MAKKAKYKPASHSQQQQNKQSNEEKPATLKDLLRPDVLDKLKGAAQEMKNAEEKRKADLRKQEEEARAAEKKRQENDFEYLLNNSKMDWRNNKS
ncbi:YqkE family protein [Paenibacillus sp. BC26]|uniref:YqkE family protein n=1 Tax=Paenibacillus sp. BC26 TaxID=1881032 RepID=UPI0008E86840|nr:YqkE family protein [Paenibacillus sp. BC26]SFS68187.1 Protein of unknown function [Paenibacillus sp. BC26]